MASHAGLVPVALLGLLLFTTVTAQKLLPTGTYKNMYTVPKGTTMYLSGTYAFEYLSIAGKVVCGHGGKQPNIKLSAVLIDVTGTFECGTAAVPYGGNVTITMTGSGEEGTRAIEVTGKIIMHGLPRTSWTTLAATVRPGDTKFSTVSPVDWQPGELLVVSSTSPDPKMSEEVRVKAVAPGKSGGTVVTITKPFKYPHWGKLQKYSSPYKTWTLDERAQVALLERNIIFQGDGLPNGNGGIISIRKTGNGWAQDVKFIKAGQLGPRLGSYPWHWHMLGERKGNYFRNNVVMRSTNRCVTVHGTDHVLVERNVCYDCIGHGYFLEDGCEEGNTFAYNLGLGTKKPKTKAKGSIDTDTTHLSTFWITNPNNYFIGNVAAGSEFAGFWFMLPKGPTRVCYQEKQKPKLKPNKLPLGRFDGNVAHSSVVGLGIESGIRNNVRAAAIKGFWDPPVYPVFNNLSIFQTSHPKRALWVTMPKTIYFRNSKFADNGGSTLFSGAQIAENSLYVGQSANALPTKRKGPVYGFGFYDGPAGMNGVHFTGYTGRNMHPLPIFPAGDVKSWNFFMKNITFGADTDPALFVPGNLSSPSLFSQGIVDTTARPYATIMMPLNNSAANGLKAPSRLDKDFNVRAPECSFEATLGAYVCTSKISWATVVIDHGFNPKKTQIVDVIRSDGKQASIDSFGHPHYQFNAVIGLAYTVRYRNRKSLVWAGTRPKSFYIYLRNLDPKQWVTIALAKLPTSKSWFWTVVECPKNRVIARKTTKARFKFRLTATASWGLGGKYPNQKQGYVRAKVCAAKRYGKCSC